MQDPHAGQTGTEQEHETMKVFINPAGLDCFWTGSAPFPSGEGTFVVVGIFATLEQEVCADLCRMSGTRLHWRWRWRVSVWFATAEHMRAVCQISPSKAPSG